MFTFFDFDFLVFLIDIYFFYIYIFDICYIFKTTYILLTCSSHYDILAKMRGIITTAVPFFCTHTHVLLFVIA